METTKELLIELRANLVKQMELGRRIMVAGCLSVEGADELVKLSEEASVLSAKIKELNT